MVNSALNIPYPLNEPIKEYKKNSSERILLDQQIQKISQKTIEIPLVIGGKEVRTGKIRQSICPHNHQLILANYHCAGEKEIHLAVEASMKAKKQWENFSAKERAAIFLRAAELISGKWRNVLNAATMLNQSKSVYQAEIDSACELIDFLRFNPWYMEKIYQQQPEHHSKGCWNQMDYRPLEGFVFAVSPFNFTAIAGNLVTAPALMGNTIVWKPASTAVLSGYYLMKLFEEAGVPEGVINFLPGSGGEVGDKVIQSRDLGGIHFTGSTNVFQGIWKNIGNQIHTYRSYPRIVGETGGKDFVFAHESADPQALAVALVRGAFEYQGQKCSAASRAYIPENLWQQVKLLMEPMIEEIIRDMGDPAEYRFFNALIEEKSFDKTSKFVENAKQSEQAEIVFGGNGDKTKGYFFQPTVIEVKDPHYITMEEELFAPVLSVYPYKEEKYEEVLRICDNTSPYALTGAIFSNNRESIKIADKILRNSAGNFYINDKPTGAVVGQQPFGGARGSGTNDKAGSMLNLLRWTSPRTLKENLHPVLDYRYPFMD